MTTDPNDDPTDASTNEDARNEDADDEAEELQPIGNQPDVIDATGGAHKVEAVAGSGKTTTMVLRLEAEIRERGVAPNRLLVLTFANEAAHTIREKLRDVLGPEEAFDVDVYTYHSFGYRLLGEYAYHVGVSPEFELVTDEDRPQLIESIYDEVDFAFVAPGSPAAGGTHEGTFNSLKRFIDSMRREDVDPGDVRSYLPPDDELRELLSLVDSLQEMAYDLVDVDANDIMWDEDELAERCDRLAIVYRAKAREFDGPGRVRSTVSDHLQAMAETADALADHFRTAAEFDWQEYKLPQAVFRDDTGGLHSVSQTPMGRLEHYAHMLRRARAFVGAYEAYMAELDARDAFDYDELIHRTVDLLGDEDVRDDVLSQWDAVYCDEFQDTDESQLRLVEELRDELDIMVVGDSDQAIHEWRGQDPENMSKLPDSFEAIDLGLNFRSRQPILDLATNLDPEKERIEAFRDPDPPNVFKVDSGGARTPEQVSTAISHLLTGRFEDVPQRNLSDIAVLVRRNRNARDIAAQLDRDSIPYTLSNETASDLTPGLRTVLAYFRLLVTPADDVSWQRVLVHLYRAPESDIDTLLAAGETLPEGYEAVAESELVAPDRVATAIADYETLTDVATTHSISELYRHFKRETRVEWFLRDRDRNALRNVERLITSFDDSPVQSGLSPAFVDYLERQATLLFADDDTATETGSQSADAVDVMTIHQAKGLDFDTVLVPFLTEAEFGHITLANYQRDLYRYDVLVDEISGDLPDPLRADCSDDQIAEEWRVLHVALTRAKDRLFLFGNSVSDDDPSADLLDSHLPDTRCETPIEWSSEGPRMRVWKALEESYDDVAAGDPESVRDYTDAVNRGVDEDPGKITYYQTEISTEDAIERLLEFADRAVAGTLATDETDTSKFAAAPLGDSVDVELARQHSHTSLEAVRDCERKHVLDHVVDAFPDPQPADSADSIDAAESDGGEDVSPARTQADVGTLFHDVAELVYWRGYDDRAEWREACRWLARRTNRTHVLDPALDCIDRYFETEAAAWPAVGAEIPIDLSVEIGSGDQDTDGESGTESTVESAVTGYIDSVRDHPDGGLAVVDYKSNREQKTLAESHQLQLYVRACQNRFDDPVTHAGYVYVGEAGPATQLFSTEELADMWDDLLGDLETAATSSFENATPGPHCEFCEHQSLGCCEDEIADARDVDFVVK